MTENTRADRPRTVDYKNSFVSPYRRTVKIVTVSDAIVGLGLAVTILTIAYAGGYAVGAHDAVVKHCVEAGDCPK